MSIAIQSGKSLNDLIDSKKYYYILGGRREAIKCNEPAFRSWHNSLPGSVKTKYGRKILSNRNSKWYVSTVFLGNAHGFDGDIPILWETLIITQDWIDYQRYLCYNDAIRGHSSIVTEMRQIYGE
jgi:hypothetical protein